LSSSIFAVMAAFYVGVVSSEPTNSPVVPPITISKRSAADRDQ